MDETFRQWCKLRPNFKHLKDWKPALIPLIIERHPSDENIIQGFIHRIITGDMGYGKTTLAYKLRAKLSWDVNGYTAIDDEENCYKEALNNMIYRPDDLINRMMKQLERDEPAWMWIIDDGSIHMGKQLYRQNRAAYDKLEDNLPTIREYVTCLLVTTPKVNNLAKPFRDFFTRKINITLEEGGLKQYTRRGKHYFKEFYPDDLHYIIRHPYDDRYSCLVPEPFYSWMHQKKIDALKEYHAMKRDKEGKTSVDEEDDVES